VHQYTGAKPQKTQNTRDKSAKKNWSILKNFFWRNGADRTTDWLNKSFHVCQIVCARQLQEIEDLRARRLSTIVVASYTGPSSNAWRSLA
jgi:hypothetical protein